MKGPGRYLVCVSEQHARTWVRVTATGQRDARRKAVAAHCRRVFLTRARPWTRAEIDHRGEGAPAWSSPLTIDG